MITVLILKTWELSIIIYIDGGQTLSWHLMMICDECLAACLNLSFTVSFFISLGKMWCRLQVQPVGKIIKKLLNIILYHNMLWFYNFRLWRTIQHYGMKTEVLSLPVFIQQSSQSQREILRPEIDGKYIDIALSFLLVAGLRRAQESQQIYCSQ